MEVVPRGPIKIDRPIDLFIDLLVILFLLFALHKLSQSM